MAPDGPDTAATDFEALLGALVDAEVLFIVVGGIAGILHGADRATYDLDVVYDRSPENLARLVRALAVFEPYLRGAPPGLPFRWDAATLASGLNFTLTTKAGAIDLLGEIPGGGDFAALRGHTIELDLFGRTIICISLERLIHVKRAAGRPKDLEAIAELEHIAARRERGSSALDAIEEIPGSGETRPDRKS